MAIFHLTAKIVSRGNGQSALAKAAYNAREKLRDERTGEIKDYSRKDGLVFSGIFAPPDAPQWARDRAQLWNAVERKEDRSTRPQTAQLARNIDIALPHELTDEQRRQLVTDFVREQFVRKGMIADVAIHAPARDGDDRNHHAHILLTLREIGPDGFGKKVRAWNDRGEVERWRKAWERTTNRYLERHDHDIRIDRRTLEAQGIERQPTQHRGPQISAMEGRGITTDRGAAFAETFGRHATIGELKTELRAVEKQIDAMSRSVRAGGRVAPERDDNVLRRPAGYLASQAIEGAAGLAGSAVEFLGDMVGATPLTPDRIRARIDAKQKAAQQREIDWEKFRMDALYRQQIETQTRERMEKEREERERDEKRKRERERER